MHQCLCRSVSCVFRTLCVCVWTIVSVFLCVSLRVCLRVYLSAERYLGPHVSSEVDVGVPLD